MTDTNQRPKRRADLSVRILHDGCAILDVEGEAAHVLNSTAAYLLELCDGTRSAADLVRELQDAAGDLSETTARRDVEACLADLRTKKIIE